MTDLKIITPESKKKDEEMSAEARKLWNDKLATQELEQRALHLKAQSQFYDKMAETCSEITILVKDFKPLVVDFFKATTDDRIKSIVKNLDKIVDGRILKVLVDSGLLPPQVLDVYNRAQGRQAAVGGQPQPQQELDVGGQVLADFNGQDLNVG